VPLLPILIAEDNDDDALILRRLLVESGVRNPIHRVCDGEEAIAYLKGEGIYSDRSLYDTPAVFLLDWFMKRTSGMEVLDWTKTQPKPTFPIVVLTGLANMNELREAYQRGAYSFLVKPFTKADLLELVDKFKNIEVGPVP
jgi:CheY-like chemotaxis protein